ncbi:MAG: winged helix-turn-helix domain-containing protein [Planctomycetota bacterium]|jgi:molybdate transport system regulatory protein
MELNFKIWLTHNGEMVLGKGRAQLLEAVDAAGSIAAAARSVDLSYRHAWAMISSSEKRLGRALVERFRGGRGGGTARLTSYAQRLLNTYRGLQVRFAQLAERTGKGLKGI